MKNKMLMIVLFGIILIESSLLAATTVKKKSTTKKTTSVNKKRKAPQNTKIKYKEVIGITPFVTFVKAQEIALEHAGIERDDADISKILMSEKNKELVYQIKFYAGSNEYNYIISSNKGQVLNYSQTSRDYMESNKNFLGNDKIKEIMLEKIPGAKDTDVYEIRLNKNDRIPIYKGRVVYNGMDYKFIINAIKGNVINFEETVFTSL